MCYTFIYGFKYIVYLTLHIVQGKTRYDADTVLLRIRMMLFRALLALSPHGERRAYSADGASYHL